MLTAEAALEIWGRGWSAAHKEKMQTHALAGESEGEGVGEHAHGRENGKPALRQTTGAVGRRACGAAAGGAAADGEGQYLEMHGVRATTGSLGSVLGADGPDI